MFQENFVGRSSSNQGTSEERSEDHSTNHSGAALPRQHVKLPELDVTFLRTGKDIADNPDEIKVVENARRLLLVVLSKNHTDPHQYVEMEKGVDRVSWRGSVRLKQGAYQYLFMVVPEKGDHFLRTDKSAVGQERANIEDQERPVSILMVTGRA